MGKTVYHRRRRVRRQLPVLIGIAVVALLLSVILLAVFLPKKPVDTPADPATDDPQPTPAVTVTMPLPQSFVDDNTTSKYIVLYDVNNDAVLYSKQADTKCYPASMTKLLTAIVTVKYAKEDTVFTVGDEIRLIDPESSRA